MLTLDGLEYSVKTPEENTDDLVNFINDYCASKNIKNSVGETIYIEKNEANPLFMMVYANAYLATILQKLIYSAGCSMSVPESSDNQLLNIADIAGIARNAATKTTITGTVYSNIADEGAVPCVITRELTAVITSGSYQLRFHPAFNVTVPIGEARQIVLICEDYGAFNISENAISSFQEVVPGFRSMTTLASIPGQGQESISSLRTRIQRRAVEGTQADRAAEAIQSLDGVALCSIYFNESPSTPRTIGSRSLVVPPRQALLMVQGYSDDIAKTFFTYMICETAGKEYATSVGAYTQNYTTRAGQTLPVWIVPPVQTSIYIELYVYETLTYTQVNGIKDLICSLSSSITIGQAVTTKMIIDVVAGGYPDITIQGAGVSKTPSNFSYQTTPDSDAVFTFSLDNIQVVGVGK